MGTAGDDFLRGMLGTREEATNLVSRAGDAPPPVTRPSERNSRADEEINRATREAEEAERQRRENGPPDERFGSLGVDKSLLGGGGGSGGPKGGYEFDEDTIVAKLGEWKQLRSDIESDNGHLKQAGQVLNPPSDDQPAREQAEATLTSISAAILHNTEMLKYADNYILQLEAALKAYRTRELAVTDTLNSGSPNS
ncbi:MAG: hypothetical protein QOI21_3816 [Actinomycetota bacterium]|jgi:hypothetical protein|nr:hypothetical protein [Actinomycetota bacterium]